MSALSYITQKGYFTKYEEAKREHGRAVYESKIVENLYLAAQELTEGSDGTESPELKAVRNAEEKIVIANLKSVAVAGKIFVL